MIGIDPGPTTSALVCVNDCTRVILYKTNAENARLLQRYVPTDLTFPAEGTEELMRHAVAFEWIQCFGKPVGADTFHACRWIGRFQQAVEPWAKDVLLITRSTVKSCLCGSVRARDSHIRQAIIDRYGGNERAIGRKKTPGPLYGVKTHMWSALAVALTALDRSGSVNGREVG